MTTQEWIAVISQILAIAAALGVGGKWMKGHLVDIKSRLPILVKDVQAVGSVVEDVTKLPAVGAVKTVLDTEVHHVEDLLRKSRILTVAGTALHTFEKGVTALSENEKGTVIQFVQTELKKLGIEIDVPEVLGALSDVQAQADRLKNTSAYKNTVALDASIQAMKEAATTLNQA